MKKDKKENKRKLSFNEIFCIVVIILFLIISSIEIGLLVIARNVSKFEEKKSTSIVKLEE